MERAAVRGAVVSLDAAYREILGCHAYPSGLRRLIGETLAAVCLLANSLKFQGSLILQLPGATDVDAAMWGRAAAAVDAAPAAFGAADAHALLGFLFPGDDVRAFRARSPRFGCSCSRQRVAGALRLLGRAEVESILAERG